MNIPIPSLDSFATILKKGLTINEQAEIINLRSAAVALQTENVELKEQVSELKRELEIKGKLVWDQPYYWLGDGEKREGPFCQLCWDKERKLIHLQGGKNGEWHCLCCDNRICDRTYQPQPPRTRYVVGR